jgi:hypothetical protein
LTVRWLLGLVLPAAARLARIHLVREPGTRVAVGTLWTSRRGGAPRHAGILAFLIIIVVLARAAPECAHVATSRVLALLGELVIQERVLAIVARDAPPGRWLEAVIGATSRRHGNASGVAIGLLDGQATHAALLGCALRRHGRHVVRAAIRVVREQPARPIPLTGRHLARDRWVQRLELRPERAVARLHVLERNDALHLLARIGAAAERLDVALVLREPLREPLMFDIPFEGNNSTSVTFEPMSSLSQYYSSQEGVNNSTQQQATSPDGIIQATTTYDYLSGQHPIPQASGGDTNEGYYYQSVVLLYENDLTPANIPYCLFSA